MAKETRKRYKDYIKVPQGSILKDYAYYCKKHKIKVKDESESIYLWYKRYRTGNEYKKLELGNAKKRPDITSEDKNKPSRHFYPPEIQLRRLGYA